ncbi:MAG: hypothetical protein ABL876_09750 [Chitinophagaceae bacterium]
MKRTSFLWAIAFLLLASCNQSKTKDASITGEDTAAQINKVKDAAEDMEKVKDELGKLEPLSLDQLKALIPETLMGGKRTEFDATASSGTGMVTADYELNDSITITLNIYDCAGPGGAGIYSMQYLGLLNIQEENEEEYTKSIDINGGKGFEHCDKTSNDCTVTFFSGGRFLVSLEGDNVGAPALREAASQLRIK